MRRVGKSGRSSSSSPPSSSDIVVRSDSELPSSSESDISRRWSRSVFDGVMVDVNPPRPRPPHSQPRSS